MTTTIGQMDMPQNFRYREVMEKGRPTHDRSDRFFLKYPAMPPAKRAKLFMPFDALRGFDFEILTARENHEHEVCMHEARLPYFPSI